MKLGGTMFTHNVLKYDYCVEPALRSLLDSCDQVIVVDCGSTDGTEVILHQLMEEYAHLEVVAGEWECSPDLHRLSMLTNRARDFLDDDIDWYINIQCDEVIHEDSIQPLRTAIGDAHGVDGLIIQRFNLWGDVDKYIPPDHPKRPVSHNICRVARRNVDSVTDAESLAARKTWNAPGVRLVHYGFVRDPVVMLDKILYLQSWFGLGGTDQRVVMQKETLGRFDPDYFIPRGDLLELPFQHPEHVQNWVESRRQFYGGSHE